jgi:hypothetical protein
VKPRPAGRRSRGLPDRRMAGRADQNSDRVPAVYRSRPERFSLWASSQQTLDAKLVGRSRCRTREVAVEVQRRQGEKDTSRRPDGPADTRAEQRVRSAEGLQVMSWRQSRRQSWIPDRNASTDDHLERPMSHRRPGGDEVQRPGDWRTSPSAREFAASRARLSAMMSPTRG